MQRIPHRHYLHMQTKATPTQAKAQAQFVNEDMVFRVRCAEQTVRDTQERVRTTCRRKIQISTIEARPHAYGVHVVARNQLKKVT